MAIRIRDLIQRVPAGVEGKVRRACEQARPVIQEALRTECRLAFRTAEETEQNRAGPQVPVKVEPGYPDVLKDIQFHDELQRVLLLSRYRKSLENSAGGVGPDKAARRTLAAI